MTEHKILTFWPFMEIASYLLQHSQAQLSDSGHLRNGSLGHVVDMWTSLDVFTKPRRAVVLPLHIVEFRAPASDALASSV